MQGTHVGPELSLYEAPDGRVYGEIDTRLYVPKMHDGLHLKSEYQLQQHDLGTSSPPGGGGPDMPNILYARSDGHDGITLGQLQQRKHLPENFRYVDLILDGKLQYVKQLSYDDVIARGVDVLTPVVTIGGSAEICLRHNETQASESAVRSAPHCG